MMSPIETAYQTYLAQRKSNDLLRQLIDVRANGVQLVHDGKTYINFSSNDYLGLCQDERLTQRAIAWAKSAGTGVGASRLVTGNIDLFSQVERKIADLKKTQAALLMASGFQANAGVLDALFDKRTLGAEPLVFSDRLNHASMHFGCAAAGIRQIRYRHADATHLATLLDKHRDSDQPKFILTESVFSMDGDVAPMAELSALALAHKAFLICDDAHATGILGPGGKGLSDGADLIIGTCSKALGAFGAFVACSQTLRDYLVNRCSGLIYSTGLPPQVLGAIDASLDLLPDLDAERAHARAMADMIRNTAQNLGIETGASTTQIIPLIVGEASAALSLSDYLRQQGFWAGAIRPPTVPKNTARLRIAVSARHAQHEVEAFCSALKTWAETHHRSAA